MMSNYFKIVWRNFLKFKVFSFINIGGLAVGLAGCLALLLYVSYEWGYDKQFSNHSNIYRVYENQAGGNSIHSFPVTPAAFAAAALQEIPGVKRAVRFLDDPGALVGSGDKNFGGTAMYADTGFFHMLDYAFPGGNSRTALQDPHSVVLSRKMAGILFGNENAMGKVIRLNNKESLTVTGVMEDLPPNETLQFDFVLPWSLYEEENSWIRQAGWGSNVCYTLIELTNADVFPKANSLIRQMVKAHMPAFNAEGFLHPMSRWHLYSKFENGKEAGGQIEQVRLFSILAIGILLIACINFMNLSTARSQARAKEVGIRKAIGSSRKDLIRQFFIESFFFSGMASLLAILLLTPGLPLLNRLLGTNLHIPYSDGGFWKNFALLTLITALIAGSYPSLYLSSFRPVKVLKGFIHTGKSVLRFRQGMVVLQFTLALFLIIATVVIYLQISYIRNKPIGYDTTGLVEVPVQGALAAKSDLLKTELLRSGVAGSVCKLSHSMTNIWRNGWDVSWPGKRKDEKILFHYLGTGYDFTRTTGVQIISGRDFSQDHATDSAGILINETAARVMGLKDPAGARIQLGDGHDYPILGVFRDFVFGSPFRKVPPIVVYIADQPLPFLSIKLNPRQDLAGSIARIGGLMKKIDPDYPPVINFLDQELEKKYASQKLTGALSAIFCSLAIFISCMGLFGLAIFAAEQRIKEIGIRKVLGAGVSRIVQLLSADYLRLVMLASFVAFPLAWWSMHNWLQQFDYRVSLYWWIFPAAGLLTGLIVLATVSIHALRAALANPVRSLRSE